MTWGFGGFLLLLGGSCSCGEGAGFREGAGPGSKFFIFCLQIEIQKLISPVVVGREIQIDIMACWGLIFLVLVVCHLGFL